MNNHTASVLLFLFLAVFGLSLMMNIPATHRVAQSHNLYNQPLGKGLIKVSNTSDDHIAIPDTTEETPPESAPSDITPTVVVKERTTLSKVITANMLKVRSIAKEFGHHETMQAILLQESNGGTAHPVGNLKSPVGKRSYGIMQVQVVAARSILTRYPAVAEKYFPDRKVSAITEEEIIALLLRNDEANIRIAVYHFNLYLSLSKGNWDKAVAAYNMGIGNANKRSSFENVPYVQSIQSRIKKTVKPFNHKHTNSLTT